MVAFERSAICRRCHHHYLPDLFRLKDGLCPHCAARIARLESRFGGQSPLGSYWRDQSRFSAGGYKPLC